MTRAFRAASIFFPCVAALVSQDFEIAKMQLLSKGFTFTEGPAWSKDGYLIFSDLPADKLMKWIPGHDVEVYRTDAHGPSGNAFDLQGRLYTCETRTRRITRTDKTGKTEVLAGEWEGKRLNAPDHIVVSKTEHVYFTDPAFGSQIDRRELDFNGVYHLPPKGPLKLIARFATRPNGIAISPNGRVLYLSNSDEHNVRAYDLDKNGDASNERIFIANLKAPPLGLNTDDKGNLYVAAAGIAVYSADGKLLHTMPIHEPPTASVLGEADLKTLFV